MLCFRRRFQRLAPLAAAVVRRGKGKHDVEGVHVEADFFMNEADIVNDRRDVLQMFAAQRGRNFLGVRIARQQTQVIVCAFQPALAATRGAVTVVQAQRQVDAGADRNTMPFEELVKRGELVEVGLDVWHGFLVAEQADHIEIIEIMLADQREEFVQNGFRQGRHLAAVQRNIERQHPGVSQLFERMAQGRDSACGIDFQRRLRCLCAEVAVGTIKIAAQRRHIEQMDAALEGRRWRCRNSL